MLLGQQLHTRTLLVNNNLSGIITCEVYIGSSILFVKRISRLEIQ